MSNAGHFIRTFVLTFLFSGLMLAGYFFISKPEVMAAKEVSKKLENVLYLYTKDGRVVIEMLPDIAPKHVEQIKKLVRKGFYDGLSFHRVIEGFMVQGGDPKGDGTGGSGVNIPAEFSKLKHTRSACSMARAQSVNSADSQFFIVTKDSLFLDGQYTIWGYVTSGMEYVDKIKKGDQHNNGMVQDPDKIVKIVVAMDEETSNAVNNKKHK